jgi:hypothetical protein
MAGLEWIARSSCDLFPKPAGEGSDAVRLRAAGGDPLRTVCCARVDEPGFSLFTGAKNYPRRRKILPAHRLSLQPTGAGLASRCPRDGAVLAAAQAEVRHDDCHWSHSGRGGHQRAIQSNWRDPGRQHATGSSSRCSGPVRGGGRRRGGCPAGKTSSAKRDRSGRRRGSAGRLPDGVRIWFAGSLREVVLDRTRRAQSSEVFAILRTKGVTDGHEAVSMRFLQPRERPQGGLQWE